VYEVTTYGQLTRRGQGGWGVPMVLRAEPFIIKPTWGPRARWTMERGMEVAQVRLNI
jgi:hypothetical protein